MTINQSTLIFYSMIEQDSILSLIRTLNYILRNNTYYQRNY